jgi:hypothetical protein
VARIGLIQTRGIGDIIIALPIATALARGGDTVFWPIDAAFVEGFRRAAPWVEFLPVPSGAQAANPRDYFLGIPEGELRARGCERSLLLYSSVRLDGVRVANEKLAAHLKFDEYKYAVSGIPFREKWNLEIRRDAARERRLHESLGIRRPYICVHRGGPELEVELDIPPDWRREFQFVEVGANTDSPFDWIYTLENAAKLVLVDSCMSNLVEQLGLPNEKYLVLRSPGAYTPVMSNGWKFI